MAALGPAMNEGAASKADLAKRGRNPEITRIERESSSDLHTGLLACTPLAEVTFHPRQYACDVRGLLEHRPTQEQLLLQGIGIFLEASSAERKQFWTAILRRDE